MSAPDRIGLEICVDSAAGLHAAAENGADRIELCAALSEGGLTPSAGMMEIASRLSMPVRAMIRPRAGSFTYNDADLDIMRRDIEEVAASALEGVVLGCNDESGNLDETALAALVCHARALGLKITLHRSFDLVRDPLHALNVASTLGIDTILTSGQQPTAMAGLELIARLVQAAHATNIQIMAGGGFGLIGNIIVGIVGAFVAGWLLPRIGIYVGTTEHGNVETENEVTGLRQYDDNVKFWSHHHNPRTVANRRPRRISGLQPCWRSVLTGARGRCRSTRVLSNPRLQIRRIGGRTHQPPRETLMKITVEALVKAELDAVWTDAYDRGPLPQLRQRTSPLFAQEGQLEEVHRRHPDESRDEAVHRMTIGLQRRIRLLNNPILHDHDAVKVFKC